jgi:ankyrin repeat protein
VDEKYRESVSRGQGGHENFHDGLPSYIKVGSDEELRWRRSHPSKQSVYTGQTEAHSAAAMGDLESLLKVIDEKKDMVHKKDVNGWTPIHEAARAGHVEVVRTLVERGADVNQVTGLTGEGGQSVLHLAIQHHGEDHPLVDYLLSLDAMNIGPEL